MAVKGKLERELGLTQKRGNGGENAEPEGQAVFHQGHLPGESRQGTPVPSARAGHCGASWLGSPGPGGHAHRYDRTQVYSHTVQLYDERLRLYFSKLI